MPPPGGAIIFLTCLSDIIRTMLEKTVLLPIYYSVVTYLEIDRKWYGKG